MFRKFACILSAVGMLMMFRVFADAAVFQGAEIGRCPEAQKLLPAGAVSFLAGPSEGSTVSLLASPAAQEEPPNTGDYPAPIFTAMLISLGIVLVLVMTENRRK